MRDRIAEPLGTMADVVIAGPSGSTAIWPTAWRRIRWTAAYSRARGLRPSNGDGLDIAVDDGRIVGVCEGA